MKILKHGKVEQRRFVCPKCGCEFVASEEDMNDMGWTRCPKRRCAKSIAWANGEPYEEPTPTQTDRERLEALLQEGTDKPFFMRDLAKFLLENGVTFREG